MIRDILLALDSFPRSNLLFLFIGSLTNPIILGGVISAGWLVKPWWKGAIVSANWVILVRLGMLPFNPHQEGMADLYPIESFFFKLVHWIPFILFQASAGAIFAAILAFVRSALKKPERSN